MLDTIKNQIQGAIAVEVGQTNANGSFPVIVKDTLDGSITRDWSLTYNPKLITANGPERLYDGREAFSTLRIANFSSLYDALMGVDQRFLKGELVEMGNNNTKRATYEMNGARFTVVEYESSVSISLTITQEKSPFHMLNINFRIVNSDKNPGSRHLIGSENYWDRNTNMFTEQNASLTPKKRRMLQVYQDRSNSQVTPYIKTLTQPGNTPNTSFVHPDQSPFEYVQDVRSKYKALAYIQEQTIIEIAMERALAMLKQHSSAQPQEYGFQPQQSFDPNAPFGQQPTFAPQQPVFGTQQGFAGQQPFGQPQQQSAPQQQQNQPQAYAQQQSFQGQSQWTAYGENGKPLF